MDRAITPLKFDIYAGDQLNRTEILCEPTIKVGKLTWSHLRLEDDSVSRMHALIEVKDTDNVVLLDLGSTGGTFVNGEKVTRRALHTGDLLQFGAVRVVVAIAGQVPVNAAAPTAAAHSAAAPTTPVHNAAALAASVRPLFDDEDAGSHGSHGTQQGRILEVMALWGTTVVDVKHLKAGSYQIGGEKGVDQCVDASWVGSGAYPLASHQGGEMVVNIPAQVTGDVLLDGQVFSLEALAEAGKLGPSNLVGRSNTGGSRALRLPAKARCRLEFGDLTFHINSVPAAPPVARQTMRGALDGQLARYLLSAGLLHLLFFAVVLSSPADADTLQLDRHTLPDRFIGHIHIPTQTKDDKVPDLFKRLADDAGKVADVAQAAELTQAARGEQGKLGKPDTTQTDRRMAEKGPAENENIKQGKEMGKIEALRTADAAFNQLQGELTGVWGAGDAALGNDAVSALGGMFDSKLGHAQGFGGLGDAGLGRGGNGLGEASIGVGRVATRGRREPGGDGPGGKGPRYGDGVSQTGEKAGFDPKVVPLDPIVTDGLDKATIQRVIRQHRNEYRYCYEMALKQAHGLNGKIVMKFTIAGNGSVIAASVDESTMNSPEVERCITAKIKRWVFEAPKGGGIVVVKYPFLFKAV